MVELRSFCSKLRFLFKTEILLGRYYKLEGVTSLNFANNLVESVSL
jgi:hypothetical protein